MPSDNPLNDPEYLCGQQYHTADNLNARLTLHTRFSKNPLGIHTWLYQALDLPPNATILEVGCGPATLWAQNLSQVPHGWRILLSDFSPGMLAAARTTLSKAARPFQFAQIHAQHLPLPSASVDAVIAHYMLYHVPDIPATLAEIRRVLRPNGELHAATLGHEHIREIYDLVYALDPTANMGMTANPFALEDGAGLLAPHFSRVTLHPYPDHLEITAVDPLVAYIRSMLVSTQATPAELEQHVRQTLARHNGIFRVRKINGLFIAQP